MVSEHDDLEVRVRELEQAVRTTVRRLAELEAGLAGGAGFPVAATLAVESEIGAARGDPRNKTPVATGEAQATLWGRTLIALAGAFLLRAATEARMLPHFAGLALGAGYALVWFWYADRAGARGLRTGAFFHGLVAVIIACPLIWEATARFHLLAPESGGAALSLLILCGLFVARRRDLPLLAWLVAGGGGVTALLLTFATRAFIPFAVVQVLLGVALLWLAYERGWDLLATVGGGFADLTLLLLVALVIFAPQSGGLRELRPGALVGLLFGAVLAYLGSFSFRIVRRGREISGLEIAQTTALLGIGLGGAMAISLTRGVRTTLVGLAILALSIAAYAVAFTFADRELRRRRNFVFFSSVAMALALLSLGGMLRGGLRAVIFSLLAVVVTVLGVRRARVTLGVHGSLYALAAALFSGLLAAGAGCLLFGRADLARWSGACVWIALAAVLVCAWLPAVRAGGATGRLSGAPRLLCLSLVALAMGGLGTALLARALSLTGAPPERFLLAGLRTAVLGMSTVVLAWVGRRERWREAAWLVYPCLGVAGVKLVLQDLRAGRPALLFFSFAIFGLALIVAPRLRRRGGA